MKIGVSGYKGRVGQLLVQAIEADDALTYAGGIDSGDDARALFESADIVIDFSVPEATVANAALAAETQTTLIACTTGLNEAQEQALHDAAKKTVIVYASNTSLAVNVLFALTEKAAQYLPDYDVEIIEAHHNKKVDAPSGTALDLGRTAAKARGQNFDDVSVLSREGQVGARRPKEIGFSTMNG